MRTADKGCQLSLGSWDADGGAGTGITEHDPLGQ